MSWMILAALPPLIWSFSNYIDEYLSNHYFTGSPFLMIIAACVIQLIPGLVMLPFFPQALEISLLMMIVLSVLGTFAILCFVPYIAAIQIDGAGVAVPIYQVIPVITFFLAWIFLGETVASIQILAAILIVMAAFAITWDFSKKSLSMKTFYLMLGSSTGIGIYNVVSRYFLTGDIDAPTLLVWSFIGTGVFGIVALVLYRPWRDDLIRIHKTGGNHVGGLFLVQLACDVAAFSLFIFAMVIAPAAGLVSTMNGLQPFFVLLVGAGLAYVLPQYFPNNATGKTLAWRVGCIIVLFIGVAILSLAE